MTQSSQADTQDIGTFWILHLDQPPPAGPVPRLPATFSRVGPQVSGSKASKELAQAMQLEHLAVLKQRFSGGKHCYVARVAGTIAAYGWVTFDEELIGEIGLSIHLQADEAYIWDCVTLPPYRGQRLYPALLAHINSELYQAGLQRVWIGADSDNLPSHSGMALAGFQPIADIVITGVSTLRKPEIRARPGVSEQIAAHIRRAVLPPEITPGA